MSVQKKSLISNRETVKKAIVASNVSPAETGVSSELQKTSTLAKRAGIHAKRAGVHAKRAGIHAKRMV